MSHLPPVLCPARPTPRLTTSSFSPLAHREPSRLYDPAGAAPHFWDYWASSCATGQGLVIAGFLVVASAAMLQTFTTWPIYTASTTLRFEKEESRGW